MSRNRSATAAGVRHEANALQRLERRIVPPVVFGKRLRRHDWKDSPAKPICFIVLSHYNMARERVKAQFPLIAAAAEVPARPVSMSASEELAEVPVRARFFAALGSDWPPPAAARKNCCAGPIRVVPWPVHGDASVALQFVVGVGICPLVTPKGDMIAFHGLENQC